MARPPDEPCSRAPPCSLAWPRYGPPVRSPRRKPHRPVPAAGTRKARVLLVRGACAIRVAGMALRSGSATPTGSGDLRRRHQRRERDRLGVRLGVRAGRGRDPGWAEHPVPGAAGPGPRAAGLAGLPGFDPAAIPATFAPDIPVPKAQILAATQKPIAAQCIVEEAGRRRGRPCRRGSWSPPRIG